MMRYPVFRLIIMLRDFIVLLSLVLLKKYTKMVDYLEIAVGKLTEISPYDFFLQ